MKPKAFITRTDFPKDAVDLIREYCDVKIFSEQRVMKKSELLRAVKGKDGLAVLVTDRVDRDIMEAGDRLRIISSWGEGYDHIDLKTASEKGILVTNTPSDDLAVAVAEATVGLILAVARRIVDGDKVVKAGEFTGWAPMDWIGTGLIGKTLGIVGLGRIGKRVVQRLQGWDMDFLYTDFIRSPDFEEKFGVKYVTLEELLWDSDFVSLHVPLTETNRHLIGAGELSLMKPTAFLINTARGALVDENALVQALQSGQIAGVALDVFENEPKLALGLKDLPNVVLTPHLAGATLRARTQPAMIAAMNLVAGLRGEIPPNLVTSLNQIKGESR